VDEQRPGGGGDARAGAEEALERREQLAARHRALLTMSAGAAIETAKRVGDPERLIEGIGLRAFRQPRARPHVDGDRIDDHHRAPAPLLHRRRPLLRPQRLALQPQSAWIGRVAHIAHRDGDPLLLYAGRFESLRAPR